MRMMVIVLAGLVLCSTLVFGGQKDYSTANCVEVYVQPGDTVWGIAQKHVGDRMDIRELMYVIRHMNGLDNNASLCPGQTLLVPLN